jgi:DNA-binding response OmpR family regulator
LNFEKWTVGIGGLTIVEVEITWGGLQIFVFRRARLGPLDLELSPRSFDLLLMLAQAAEKGEPMVTLDQLRTGYYEGYGKGFRASYCEAEDDLERSGVNSQTVDKLIANVQGEGYRSRYPLPTYPL